MKQGGVMSGVSAALIPILFDFSPWNKKKSMRSSSSSLRSQSLRKCPYQPLRVSLSVNNLFTYPGVRLGRLKDSFAKTTEYMQRLPQAYFTEKKSSQFIQKLISR